MAKNETLQLARISVRGIVQGVGFRPFVYGAATRHNLKGWVCNTSEDVKIEVEGGMEAIGQFKLELQTKAPPLAHIEDIKISYHPPVGYKSFEIRHSIAEEGKYQLISPDIATCQACLSELLDPDDRRYRYPFTNCTNCGPRFTIIEDMPYDRPKTTMRYFQMCPQCQAEYDNPLDRRFHAQPNACPKCGPHVELLDAQGNTISSPDPVASASQLLRKGKSVAIKGLGGFFLACNATNDAAVETLRKRKKRFSKPFAIMITNIEEVKRHCYVSPEEEKLLTSPQSPIVLLKWKEDSSISRMVAQNLHYLGVMLPYTPLHHVLLRDSRLPLVMTSGNISEEPIAKDNDEALRRLSGIADYFLVHNRDIYSRYDDSVAMVERGTTQLIRRARSYAPYPIHLRFQTRQVLGCGAEEKNTFCLTRDNYAFLSQHIGDMENMETLKHFDSTISLYKRLFRIEPEIIAYDLHPDYLATKYAQELGESGLKLIPVQHHHAHIASCMADNGVKPPIIGVAFDGTGMGADGHIWGGEFLLADYRAFTRKGHLEYLPLPGGDAAIKRPYRTAIGYILSLLGESALDQGLAFLPQVSDVEVEIIKRQTERGINSPQTSSMGRLFDAISAFMGIRDEIDYEGQAAVELEMAAYKENYAHNRESYPYNIIEDDEMRIVKLGNLLSAIIEDLKQGMPKGEISIKFHNTVAKMIEEVCCLIADETGIKQVALSGGVFQNRLLLRKTVNLLEKGGFKVFTHRQVPTNDGGISLGQAVVANFTE
ncbi:MAG: carbamoyltransferase HypF [Chloroflexi bacterium CG_4_10_14_0_8_um_filter_46_9]|nr:MAG: carbamoyltransferase HypF [Dehalococcoidia bacterium CG2_30_46_19]PIW39925.1 MAG: carbamoyltransferase HypF [Chloroflexi bacterium CG15_BIG_FIL_POST_REV_8_21_14_020_46_15]PIZ27088.1 MAG: carbamoyltransferase HypF [Chloroflexi bacterium CG_4_10_14_0_8_um_filter_46_9]